ncbi:MAG: TRAP transporter small permease [Candidatus Eisenbacteria bacterium]|uniref:TRAP transporter small permease n=1 Tax=Eiseniibacteriota bacterium TaxID=2212470 RepID=A0A948RU00_UNCEI|nr:TRAP transporter small permease [Candidatus Eisenbacteria bacterium]MBU1948670.1 TRAP transporter small permease [Candidatus Eisenbacteria bacterium]MBU2690980.1 TRAP transporter small permease [Candidatus Eisenbacteria bacterium]
MGESPLIFRLMTPGPVFLTVLAGFYFLLYIFRRLSHHRFGAERWDKGVRSAEGAILSLFLFTTIFLAALQIVLRNFFHTGLIWIDPLLRYIVLWIGLLGAFVATRKLRHITIDVLGRLLPSSYQAAGRILTSAVAFVASVLLANASWMYLEGEVLFGTKPFLGVPSWAASSILVAGFVGIGWRFLGWVLWPHSGGPGRPPLNPHDMTDVSFDDAPPIDIAVMTDSKVSPEPEPQPGPEAT